MNSGFEGRVVLITGGSKGIGKVVARSLIAEGVHVSICARNHENLELNETHCKSRSGRSQISVLTWGTERRIEI